MGPLPKMCLVGLAYATPSSALGGAGTCTLAISCSVASVKFTSQNLPLPVWDVLGRLAYRSCACSIAVKEENVEQVAIPGGVCILFLSIVLHTRAHYFPVTILSVRISTML